MSIQIEQYHSLKQTKQLLYDLLTSKNRPRTVKELRERTLKCLRHFPALDDDGKPLFSKDSIMLKK